jgi:hypothetical protein
VGELGLTVKQLGADLVRVTELLEEARVLWHTLDAERLVLATDGVNEVVVRDGDRSSLASDVREVCTRVKLDSRNLPYLAGTA